MKKLAVITTHPVQYYAPLFKLLHDRNQVDIKVFYTWGQGAEHKHDPGFNRIVNWDLPLLEGYLYEWAVNTSMIPSSDHFNGIKTPGLIKQITNWSPDAILVIGWAYQSHLLLMRHFKGRLPVYFRGDSTLLDNKRGVKSLFKKIFLTWVYSHIDHAFYVGKKNKEYFKNYGVNNHKLTFTPHAVDNERFGEDRTTEALELRARLGLNHSDFLILFSGKLEAKKNPEILLKAFLKIKQRPDIHLLYVGNGVLEEALKAKGSTSSNVHFLDFQNQTQMPAIYQACDVFCLPSSGPGESWGLAINEAMASRRTILASDKVGATVDLVIENHNGCSFKSGEENQLKEKLEYLTATKSTLVRYGKRSEEIIKEWNYKTIALAIEQKVNLSIDTISALT